jgi:predicted dehydrogenase
MIEACDTTGIRFGGIFPQRFNPANRALHDAARAGRFGALSVLTGIVPWWRDDAYYAPTRWQGKIALDGGGALFNQSIHTVDLLQWFAAAAMPELEREDNPVDEVFAYAGVRAHDANVVEVEDTIVIALRFRNGALGQLLGATSMWPGSHRRLIMSGRDGSAEVVEEEIVRWQFRDETPKDDAVRTRFAQPTAHAGGSSNPMAISDTPHMKNIVEFFQAMEEGRDPMLTAREAAKSVAIVQACYESARTGRPAKVPTLLPTATARR